MRRFKLHRAIDETGISGTGVVAEGAEFTDGRCVMRWTVNPARSTAFYESIADLVAIHGHGGKTQVMWIDEDTNTVDIDVLRLPPGDPRGQWYIANRRWRDGTHPRAFLTNEELASLLTQIARFAQVGP